MEVLGFFLAMFVGIGGVWWHFHRSKSLLTRWAAENGYEILKQDYRQFRRGPFWTATKGQSVYYVTVRDQQGQTRSGWVLCGGRWTGVSGDHVEVRWE